MTVSINEIEPNVHHIVADGDNAIEVFLVGTAHISQASVDLADRIIREKSPETVAIELCRSRYESIQDPERWKKTDIITIFRQQKMYVVLTQLMLAAFQKRMGDKLKVKPGAEMISSIKAANELNIPITLADRDIRTTLKRAWSSVRLWTLLKIFFSSLAGSFKDPDISEKEIELLKEGDALQALLAEFSEELPDIKEPLISERDRYLSGKIRASGYKRVVAVVGAGHVPGILNSFNSKIDFDELESIPAPKLMTKLLGMLIPTIVLAAIILGFFFSGAQASAEMVGYWLLTTGAGAAIGAVLCLAHPITIIASAVAAPITTLHPLLAAGWIGGFVEAWIRKPRVQDLETVLDDIGSMRGIWTNRLARVFLVMIVVNITTSVGMIWGTKIVAELFLKS